MRDNIRADRNYYTSERLWRTAGSAGGYRDGGEDTPKSV